MSETRPPENTNPDFIQQTLRFMRAPHEGVLIPGEIAGIYRHGITYSQEIGLPRLQSVLFAMHYGRFVLSAFNEYSTCGADAPRLATESAVRYMAQHTDIRAAREGKDSLITSLRNLHVEEGVSPNPVDTSERMRNLLFSLRTSNSDISDDAFLAKLHKIVSLDQPTPVVKAAWYPEFQEGISRFAVERFEEVLSEVDSGIYLLRQEQGM